jgi:phycocyanobilin:ferredoxin oxidoreductase
MDYKILLDLTANRLEDIIIQCDGSLKIDTEDYGWENTRYISDLFRVAHIERYSDKNLEVLHFTCFPPISSGSPIFGFDIVSTDKRPLAAFLDCSPTIEDWTYKTNYKFNTPYKLPEWANNIFSKDAIAIVPDGHELNVICDCAIEAFNEYVEMLSGAPSDYPATMVIEKQNYYCDQQQKNERTYNVLKAKLGEDRAKHFMQTILFPKLQ